MNCPKCSYPNPQGVTYCQMCYEVFNRSAADRYLHAQKRARREQEGNKDASPRSTPPPSYPPVVHVNAPVDYETRAVPRAARGNFFQSLFSSLADTARSLIHLVRAYPKEIGLAAGIIALAVLVIFYASPAQRFQLFGNRLEYRFPVKTTVGYLVGLHSEVKSWSERDGRLDTPLPSQLKDEMGTITIISSPFKVDFQASPFHHQTQKLELHAREWIVNEVGGISQSIPLNHPSLKTTRAVLDRSGVVLSRDNNFSTRIGRTAAFLLSRWPPGTHRRGNTWDEPIGWVVYLGEWKIFWRGKLHWVLNGYESRDDSTYILLHYRAEVTPSLWETPEWAKGAMRPMTFDGTTEGDVLFDNHRHQVVSHIFSQEGTLTLPITNIYRIPVDQRVGRLPRHGWFHNVDSQPGTIYVQFKDKLDIRLR